VGAPVLSPGGERIAYPATDGIAWHVVDDEHPGAAYDAIVEGSILFDTAARHLAFIARRGDSALVVVDGVSGRGWQSARGLLFSKDGARVGYVAQLGDRVMPVVDGVALRAHEQVGDLLFSPSGRSFAYSASDSGAWYVYEGASRLGPFQSVSSLAYTTDDVNEWPAFIARSTHGEAAVVRGTPRAWHTRVSSLAVAASGARWGYVADGTTVHLSSGPLPPDSAAAELVMSSNGSRFAYLAADAHGVAVVHDRGRTAFDLVVDGTLQFIDDTDVWACIAGDRARSRLFVVVDGRDTGRPLDWVEVVRFTQTRNGDATTLLRGWVAAEARAALRARDR
jgi:hypothetical protein